MNTRACIAATCLLALTPVLGAQDLGIAPGALDTTATAELERNAPEPPEELWTNMGFALEGVNGEPILSGSGSMQADSQTAIELVDAKPITAALLMVSLTHDATPFKGGTLVPLPAQMQIMTATDRNGSILLEFAWPAEMPSGVDIYMQYVIHDPAAVQTFSLSNALVAHTP